MAQSQTPGAHFREHFVEAGGFRIRTLQAGQGTPLVYLHGAGGLHLSRGHDLLSQSHRVVAVEMPGFGQSAENTRTATMPDMAATLVEAITRLDINRFDLMGTSFGGKVALWLAAQNPGRIRALVLEAPAAIRPEGSVPPSGTPAEMARRLYAHPERAGPLPAIDPAMQAKTRALVSRLRGPDRDATLEERLRDLPVPTLVLFGTLDSVISPDMGRIYKTLIPNCHLIFVYDAGHVISADRPEAFVEVVSDFLERKEAFVISRTKTLIHP